MARSCLDVARAPPARIAPKPLLVVNGDSDDLTLEGVREATAAAEKAYREGRAEDRFRLLVQPRTGHEFTPSAVGAALDWFARCLRP